VGDPATPGSAELSALDHAGERAFDHATSSLVGQFELSSRCASSLVGN
jgi:hypothetical protein